MTETPSPARRGAVIIALCVAMFALGQFHRASGAVFAPILIDRFDLSATMIGALVSAMFLATITAQTPMGAAMDRIGLRPVLALSVVTIGLGAVIFGLAESYEAAFAGRVVIGLGSASMGAASYVIVARAFPPRDFGSVNGLVVGIGGVGGLIGTYPLAWALERAPFSLVFAVAGGVAFLISIAVHLILQDPAFRAPADKGAAQSGGYLSLLKIGEFRRILALAIVTFAPIVTITGVWGGPYFRDIHGLASEPMGAVLLLLFAATIIGAFAFAWAERRAGSRRRVIFGSVSVSITCFALLALISFDGPVIPAALLFLMVFVQQFYIPLTAHMRRIAPEALMGRASTLLLFVSVAGIPLMQTGFGAILDLAAAAGAAPETGYRIAFGAMGALIAIAALIYSGAGDVEED